ncbi:MAG: FxLYD domain-containing protein [Candidatus Nitrosocosmicus sp.]|nr:FxLYD domain-containing protein [Candidatus Nitrosocosmicus sp.]MDN5867369.1 FxLYD domain-containing protein [Candidatus Nitrosocosmicus sp.]
MLKEITIIFSLLMVASFADPFNEFKNSARGQVNGTADNQNSSNPQGGKVFIPVKDLAISMSSQGMVEVDGAVRNNNTFEMHDIEITGEFFDKDGTSLGTFNEYVTQPSFLLKPNEKHAFTLFEVVSHYRLATTNITAFGDPVN